MRYELRRLAKPRTHRALQSKSRLGAALIGRVGLYGSGQPWSGSDLAADDLPSSVQSPRRRPWPWPKATWHVRETSLSVRHAIGCREGSLPSRGRRSPHPVAPSLTCLAAAWTAKTPSPSTSTFGTHDPPRLPCTESLTISLRDMNSPHSNSPMSSTRRRPARTLKRIYTT